MKIDYRDWVFTGRGSSALWAILKAIAKPGRGVLLPVNICEIVIPMIRKADMVPVYYDVDAHTGNARLEDIERAYTGREPVLLAVHNFGAPLEIDRMCAWSAEHDVFLIEDVCNSLGASYRGRPVGTWGDAAIFSFGYAKIVEHGVGGAALVRDEPLRSVVGDIVHSLPIYSADDRDHDVDYQNKIRELRKDSPKQTPGVYNPLYESYAKHLLYRLEEVQISQIQQMLTQLQKIIDDRAAKAGRYRQAILSPALNHIDEIPGQIYWRYNLLADQQVRPMLVRTLREKGILASTWYPPIVGLFETEFKPADFAGACAFGGSVINLFVDHRVSGDDIARTINLANNFHPS